jgi:hypothetical protein
MAAKSIVSFQNFRHLFIGSTDYGPTTSMLNLMSEVEVLSVRLLHSPAIERDPGVASESIEIDCYTPALTQAMKSSLATKTDVYFPASIGQHGDLALFGRAVQSDVQVMAPVGQYHVLKIKAPMDGVTYLGKVLRNSVLNSSMVANPDTGAVDGDWLTMSTVSATQTLVTGVFLSAFTGTDIEFAIQSDEAAHASPTERAAHAFTAAGSSIIRTAGPITPDSHYRVSITGTFTSAAALVVMAIA